MTAKQDSGSTLIDALRQLGLLPKDTKGSRRKILDFYLVPGGASAKIQNDSGSLTRVELIVEQFNENQWERVLSAFANNSYYLAFFLADAVPADVEQLFTELDLSLLPRIKSEVRLSVSGDPTQADLMTMTFLNFLANHLNSQPFSLFLLRGKGKEEIIFNIEQRRLALRHRTPLAASVTSTQKSAPQVDAPLRIEDKVNYQLAPVIEQMTFNIKADELPAALLKRLDILPLAGLENDIEPILELAYNQITRRGQSYGLGL